MWQRKAKYFGPNLKIFLVLVQMQVNSYFCAAAVSSNFICPPPQHILPCECTVLEAKAELVCIGDTVSQNSIKKLAEKIRLYNIAPNSNTSNWLNVGDIFIRRTTLKEIDVTPFVRFNFTRFDITMNYDLRTVLGPMSANFLDDTEEFRFAAKIVDAEFSPFGDGGAVSLLEFVVPESIQILSLKSTDIQLSDELVSAFSFLTQLDQLDLRFNRITRIAGGQFKFNGRLTRLDLSMNWINEIGRDAFLLDRHEGHDDYVIMKDLGRLQILLDSNELTDDKISDSHSLQFIGRPVSVSFQSNQFDSISAQNFEPFLLAGESNQLNFFNNKFVCNERIGWVRADRDKFESRLIGIVCENNPGETVFTTNLLA